VAFVVAFLDNLEKVTKAIDLAKGNVGVTIFVALLLAAVAATGICVHFALADGWKGIPRHMWPAVGAFAVPVTVAIGLIVFLNLQPHTYDEYLKKGAQYMKHEKFSSAIDYYTRAIRTEPRRPVGYIKRGEAHFENGDYDKAIADYTRYISLQPSDLEAYNMRGEAHLENNNPRAALKDFTFIIERDTNDAGAYFNRGETYYAQGKLNLAISDYSMAIKVDPEVPAGYAKRGFAYDDRGLKTGNRGDYRLALRDLSTAIRLEPEHAANYYNRAIVYHHLNDNKKAIADLRKCLSLSTRTELTEDAQGMLRDLLADK
jgi:tetratricopeptide (TPR) repeat protein